MKQVLKLMLCYNMDNEYDATLGRYEVRPHRMGFYSRFPFIAVS